MNNIKTSDENKSLLQISEELVNDMRGSSTRPMTNYQSDLLWLGGYLDRLVSEGQVETLIDEERTCNYGEEMHLYDVALRKVGAWA